MVEKTESLPLLPFPDVVLAAPPAPTVMVYVVPLTREIAEPVLNPPAPPAPDAPSLYPPPPPPATTKYSTNPPVKDPLEVNVWIVLPPADVTVPPVNACEPA
jgi:hypothetical protein